MVFVLLVALGFAQGQEYIAESKTGERFVYYRMEIGSSKPEEEIIFTLLGKESFPQKDTADFRRLAREVSATKVRLEEVTSKRLVFTGGKEYVHEEVAKALGKYFQATMRKDTSAGADYFQGPWHIDRTSKGYMALIEPFVFGQQQKYSVSIHFTEPDAVEVEVLGWRGVPYHFRVYQRLKISREAGKPRVVELQWLVRKELQPKKLKLDLWNWYVQKYVVDLPPELSKFFTREIAAYLAREAKDPNIRWISEQDHLR